MEDVDFVRTGAIVGSWIASGLMVIGAVTVCFLMYRVLAKRGDK
jgi:hypothetical protein